MTECDCDECGWAVARFRGKTPYQLRPEDTSGGEGGNVGALTPVAFHYFLPGLLRLALDEPDEVGTLAITIIDRFVVSDRAAGKARARVERAIRCLTPRQRRVVSDFVKFVQGTVPLSPIITESACDNLLNGKVRPYSQERLEQWTKQWLAERRRSKRT